VLGSVHAGIRPVPEVHSLHTAAVVPARRNIRPRRFAVAVVDIAGRSPEPGGVRSPGQARESRIGLAGGIAAGRSLGCTDRKVRTLCGVVFKLRSRFVAGGWVERLRTAAQEGLWRGPDDGCSN
jgi:hypothetical protein